MRTPTRSDVRAVCALALVTVLVQIPFLERGVSPLDEGSILAIADGLRNGETLYRDRVTIIAPLTYEWLAMLLRVFGPDVLVGRIFQALVFSTCAVLMYAILREFVGVRWALLGALSLLPVKSMAFPSWTMVGYSQIAMMLSLAAIFALLRFVRTSRRVWLAAAGFSVGVTLITKQNLGAFLGAAVVGTLALEVGSAAERRMRRLIAEGALLACSALPPVLAVLVVYASRGTLGDFFDRTIASLGAVLPEYRVPFPGFRLWSVDPATFTKHALFAYFPTPIWHMAWQGQLSFDSLPIRITAELAVRAAYVVPLVALGVGAWAIARSPAADQGRNDRCRLAAIVGFATLAYASMLYRPDWAHLMNIYPPLLIVCVVMLQRSTAGSGSRAALVVLVAWLVEGVACGMAIAAVYRIPVESSRGRLLAPHYEAEDARLILAYLERRPAHARILLLRADPLYYFLSGRRIPGPFDLLVPGYLRQGDDERLARSLSSINEVVYNPKLIPTIPTPITEYAPLTARALATDFRVTEIVSPSAFVMTPHDSASRHGSTVVDLWDEFRRLRQELSIGDRTVLVSPDPHRRVQPTSWMMFRVITSTVLERDVLTCFVLPHSVGSHEAIDATPISHPDRWVRRARDIVPEEHDAAVTGTLFEISVREGSAPREILYSETRPLAEPGQPISIDLERFNGRSVEIRFCTSASPNGSPGPAYAPAGWAESRIIRHEAPAR